MHYINPISSGEFDSQVNTENGKNGLNGGQTKSLRVGCNMYAEYNKTFQNMLKKPNARYRNWTKVQIERLHEYFKSKKKPRKEEYKKLERKCILYIKV
jgi:hypothetical protein